MTTKKDLIEGFAEACREIDDFINHASYNGGMHMEARLKLIENRMDAMFWFVDKLIKALPDDENTNERPAENVGE